ncbi:unnamed protein product [Vitrella brassicaformis CCMP3155]|uniref:U6 snRNA-associated Sm-like protein LSm8 n=1 Tax=Vitrella brassicaformis (strain CCMP3155) TaxID=1169540 RepID=A0A0G4FWI2_VITBC|nr:unnamed protein product [Vitrella brassicaformis CCMP3155]|mmetsp:Transcript_1612/g.3490  ORF Transcript_1612/g.3490 Transcript_1612/m.3490 type:complete len:97 (-) Transcript_1612:32-322(-)|eukprot:CEM19216.1 unnamed protein product [Vitrella brassicaformis CCMP3155]
MTSILQPSIDQRIAVVTNDGRLFVGTLRGFDQTTNVILQDASERVYSQDQGVEEIQLGLYVVRGDNIAIIGEIDDVIDSEIDHTTIRAAPLKPVVH